MQWKRQCEAEIAKRGLQFHDIGHGFTTYPFGINNDEIPSGTDVDALLSEEQREFMALRDGKRGIRGRMNCAQFCMSNSKARSRICDYVVDYSKKYSNVDFLHVWLADGSNNHCECEECQKKTPSDWYMIFLNEIDEKLTEAGLNTRIVFISYTDTTWAPLEEKINNPDRLTMLFAPIYRSFAYSMPEGKGKTDLKPYNRNKNVFPNSLASSFDYFDQ